MLLSLLLQFGCPVETIRHALTREDDKRAAGPIGVLLDLIEDGRGELVISLTEDPPHAIYLLSPGAIVAPSRWQNEPYSGETARRTTRACTIAKAQIAV